MPLRMLIPQLLRTTARLHACKLYRCLSGSRTVDFESSITSAYNPAGPVDSDDPMVQELFQSLMEGKRTALARAITLVESLHPGKKAQGQTILSLVLERLKHTARYTMRSSLTFRIGLSGPPGAGKSTFIEAFGLMLTGQGFKVAVLAVDPSSRTTGGSLMGDKTRMPQLSVDPNAYIRPTPSGGTLGGVARNTSEAIVLCEGAGYDIVLVETIGVGQSEYAVADMVDVFCLLIPPAGGDELQGMKRGIMEMADIVVVNKCDGDLIPAARRVAMEYTSALKFIRPRSTVWKPKVVKVSSKEKTGLPDLWTRLREFQQKLRECGELERRRREQHKIWLWTHIREQALGAFSEHQDVRAQLPLVEARVASGEMAPGLAADYLIGLFRGQ